MDTELIKCLHKLSTKANRIILSKIEINHIVQIEDEFELEQFFFVRNSQLKNYPVSRLLDKFLKEYHII